MSVAPRRLMREERGLLGLPLRDALLVLVVAATIALTIIAFAAKTLGAPDTGAPRHVRSSLDEPDLTPVSTLGGTPDDPARHD